MKIYVIPPVHKSPGNKRMEYSTKMKFGSKTSHPHLGPLTGWLGPPPAAALLLLQGRDRRRCGLLVAQLEVGAHLVVDVAFGSDDVPLAVGGGGGGGVGLVEDGAGAAGRANHPVG